MNFISINDLTKDNINYLIKNSLFFKNEKIIKLNYEKIFAVNLFFEPSTRTLFSFKMAEKKLMISYDDFEIDNSSFKKGETKHDTFNALKFLGYNLFVVRTSDNNFFEDIKDIPGISFINAGSGTSEHPSQALLDAVTIYENFKTLNNLNVLFLGDIKHSRVYNSNCQLLKKYNCNISWYAPKNYKGDDDNYRNININDLSKYDVIFVLRVQKERHLKYKEIKNYNLYYGINQNNIMTLNDNAIILHPGPVNQNIEICKSVLKNKKIKVLDQVENGVYARMSILKWIIEKNEFYI